MTSLANAADAADIAARVQRVTPDSVRLWGTMNPAEMFCHLADAYECAFGRRAFVPADTWVSRTVLKFVALRVPMKWPPNIETRPEFDVKRDGTRSPAFDANRARALALVGELASLTRVPPGSRHPVFGPMSLADWHRWGYLHADHHLRQFSA